MVDMVVPISKSLAAAVFQSILLLWIGGALVRLFVGESRTVRNHHSGQAPTAQQQLHHWQESTKRLHQLRPPYSQPHSQQSFDPVRQREQRERHQRLLQQNTTTLEDIRQALLDPAVYDKRSYPFAEHWRRSSNRTGVPIGTSLNFHRVYAVDVTKSTVDLIVWVRQEWYDPRLTWSGAAATLHAWVDEGSGPGGEVSEIWTPDLHLWNAAEPLATSLANSHAIVNTSNGHVFWSRPGHLRPACKFTGLSDFPFDTLQCVMEIGSWGHSGLFLRPMRLDGDGYTMGGSQTAGEAYTEFKLVKIQVEEYGKRRMGMDYYCSRSYKGTNIILLVSSTVYPPFIEAPNEDWPVLLYTVTFVRAWQPYVRSFLILQVLLNISGFLTFWLPVSERMGLSMTAVLAAVASELVVTEKLPAFGEWSWVTRFSLASMIFTALALLENVVVMYLHYPDAWGGKKKTKWHWARLQCSSKEPGGSNGNSYPQDPQKEDKNAKHNTVRNRRSTRKTQLGSSSIKSGNTTSIPLELSRPAYAEFYVDSSSSSSLGTTGLHPKEEQHTQDSAAPKTVSHEGAEDGLRTMLHWQDVAAQIDGVSRVVFPLSYVVYLIAVFAHARKMVGS